MAAQWQEIKQLSKCRMMWKETTIKKLWRQVFTDRIFSAVSRPCNWCWWLSANQIVVQTKNPIWFYLQTRETGSFHLSLRVLLRKKRERQWCRWRAKNLMAHIKDLMQVNKFQHRLDTLRIPRNNKRTMKCNPIHSFVNVSRNFPYRSGDVLDVWLCFFFLCLSVWVWISGQQTLWFMTGWWCHPCGRPQFFCFSSSEERGTVVLKRLGHHLPLFSF